MSEPYTAADFTRETTKTAEVPACTVAEAAKLYARLSVNTNWVYLSEELERVWGHTRAMAIISMGVRIANAVREITSEAAQ